MPISSETLRSLDDSLSRLAALVEASLDSASGGEIDAALAAVDDLIDHFDDLSGSGQLQGHERELLGMMRLAVVAELVPVAILEESSHVEHEWESARREVKARTGIDLEKWDQAKRVGAINNMARPLLLSLYRDASLASVQREDPARAHDEILKEIVERDEAERQASKKAEEELLEKLSGLAAGRKRVDQESQKVKQVLRQRSSSK